jgi:hypothetical protein
MNTSSYTVSKAERRTTTLLAVGAFILVLVAWQTVGMTGLLYPIRLFVSLVHELGHGMAAILSGGSFEKFEVFSNGAGLATTRGGNPLLILPAGYLGAAFFGATLLILANRTRRVREVAVGVAVFIAACVILFSTANRVVLIGLLLGSFASFLLGDHLLRFRVPLFVLAGALGLTLLATVISVTALTVGLGIAFVLALLGLFLPRGGLIFVLNFLALIVGLNAIMDIWYLLNNISAGVGGVSNDAAAMGRYTNLPGQFWAVLWVLLAAALMFAAAYIAFIQPLRRRDTA